MQAGNAKRGDFLYICSLHPAIKPSLRMPQRLSVVRAPAQREDSR
jgi:hypothetical protein